MLPGGVDSGEFASIFLGGFSNFENELNFSDERSRNEETNQGCGLFHNALSGGMFRRTAIFGAIPG